ncbi:MAG: glycoside hydrolase [Treponema sp.]|jgi:hypothetical protein|nr:glycoside hydrolase [Treponema sp.]
MKSFLFCGIVILFVLTACEQVQDSGNADRQDNTGEKPFTITGSTGALNRGSTRVFAVNPKYDVTWTVEGADLEGGTFITKRTTTSGSLTIGANETNRILTVKAVSVENPRAFDTVTVTIDGLPAVWTELTDGLKGLITNKTNRWIWFAVGVGDASFGIQVLAYGEGVGPGKGRWVIDGGSDDVLTTPDYRYPVMAYSDDDGDSWTEIHPTPALLYQEEPMCLIYDGPAGNKKFVLSTKKGSVFWSEDGIKWTRVSNVLPGSAPPDSIQYLWQVIYGDIDRADGGSGIYLVRGERGRYTWSYDGKTWEKHYTIADRKYIGEECTYIDVQYGTGIAGGKRVKMFYGLGYENAPPFHYIYTYSLDGETWELLEENEIDALQFVPLPPAGANQRILWWLDEADTSTLNFAVDTTIYKYAGEEGLIIEGPGVVSSHADFVAYGNGKFLAVGKGRRLARTDAETARKK